MEPVENETASENKPSYTITNIIFALLVIVSIVCMLYSLALGVACIIFDVFTFLSIRSVRGSEEGQEFLPTYAFLLGGIAITLLNIGYLVTSDPSFHVSVLLLGICFFLVGLALRVNRWERDRA